MNITIGEQSLTTKRPDDLDARLIAATGCTADENRAMLAKVGTPFQIARVLKPMLSDDDRSAGELATAIGEADTFDIRQAVIALLAPDAPAAAAVPAAPAIPTQVA